jgi:hypothetical protein
MLSSYQCLGILTGLFPQSCSSRLKYAFFISPNYMSCPSHRPWFGYTSHHFVCVRLYINNSLMLCIITLVTFKCLFLQHCSYNCISYTAPNGRIKRTRRNRLSLFLYNVLEKTGQDRWPSDPETKPRTLEHEAGVLTGTTAKFSFFS